MRKISYLLIFLCAIGIVMNPGISIASWCIEAADTPKYFIPHSSRAIAVDGSNNPHIAYGGDYLYYAYYEASSWHYETVDCIGSVGDYASLALDADGKAHISYHEYTNGDLKYATNKSGEWVTETVDSIGDVGFSTSITLNAVGNAYISYYELITYDNYGSINNLKYATNVSGGWIAEKVDSAAGDVGAYTSLALDTGGKAHISYYDLMNSDLQYTTNKSGGWITETGTSYISKFEEIKALHFRNLRLSSLKMVGATGRSPLQRTNMITLCTRRGVWQYAPIFLLCITPVGAAFSRELIAHECAPTEVCACHPERIEGSYFFWYKRGV